MNEYQEDLFVAKTQELLVRLGVVNNDAQWSPLELYVAMCGYLSKPTIGASYK